MTIESQASSVDDNNSNHTTTTKQTSSLLFNDAITNLGLRMSLKWGYTAYHPQTGEVRPRKPSRDVRRGGHVDIRSYLKKGWHSISSHPARRWKHSGERPSNRGSERASQRASIAKRLPPLYSHTTPFDDRPVSDSAAQHRASSTILSAAARKRGWMHARRRNNTHTQLHTPTPYR